MPPTYSLVVPIFNEEAVIPVLLKRLDVLLEALDAPAEMIFVDDGSKDTSAIVIEAKARADKRYRLIKLSRNFGHQIAITVGLDHAAGRAVIVMDADLQDPPEVVLEMIAKWKEGYDVVSAERASRQGESRFKRATADLFYRLMGRLGDVSDATQRRRFPPGRSPGARLLSRHARARPVRARHVRLDRVPPGNGDLRSPAARRGGEQVFASQDDRARGERNRLVLRCAASPRAVGRRRGLRTRVRLWIERDRPLGASATRASSAAGVRRSSSSPRLAAPTC